LYKFARFFFLQEHQVVTVVNDYHHEHETVEEKIITTVFKLQEFDSQNTKTALPCFP